MATHKFLDGNFARPRLAVFAFRFAQTKTTLRLAQNHKTLRKQGVYVFCAQERNRPRVFFLTEKSLDPGSAFLPLLCKTKISLRLSLPHAGQAVGLLPGHK